MVALEVDAGGGGAGGGGGVAPRGRGGAAHAAQGSGCYGSGGAFQHLTPGQRQSSVIGLVPWTFSAIRFFGHSASLRPDVRANTRFALTLVCGGADLVSAP